MKNGTNMAWYCYLRDDFFHVYSAYGRM